MPSLRSTAACQNRRIEVREHWSFVLNALVYTAAGEVTYREEATPVAGDGEVLLYVDAVGLCGSDLHAVLGRDATRTPPLILGHEAVATIAEGPERGLQVVVNPLIHCGVCDQCLRGRTHLCLGRVLIGMHRPGAFAGALTAPRRNLIEVPPGMAAAAAALTEPAATALHAVRLAQRAIAASSDTPLAEARTLVIGGGSVGVLVALCLADVGVRGVQLAEVSASRRATAEATGVCAPFDPIAEPAAAGSFDLVIDAVGSAATRAASIAAVCGGGVVVHLGLEDGEGGIDARQLTRGEVWFLGSYSYTPDDLQVALAKLAAGALGDLAWVEERPLSAGVAAFAELLRGGDAPTKIVLRPADGDR
ncbi:MAG: alcohol dehydrogenase catalytic domain-containing protein [Chloroflexi bacterium]|nr:alcohol dehydrogenase catalytic domain-containing protein [Chloroflexota bacterium]MDA1146072.1 alcohol dehydrogenase catalytic domain-containing protein [Chloroflexota bacterium]